MNILQKQALKGIKGLKHEAMRLEQHHLFISISYPFSSFI